MYVYNDVYLYDYLNLLYVELNFVKFYFDWLVIIFFFFKINNIVIMENIFNFLLKF